MYIAFGGRRVQSGLYRVTYVGDESTAPAKPVRAGKSERKARQSLEKHLQEGQKSPTHLSSTAFGFLLDRMIAGFGTPPGRRWRNNL